MRIIVQSEFHDLAHRDQLGESLNAHGLTGKGVEVGTLHGGYAKEILNTWRGHLYCVDPWRNQARNVYFDQANDQNMEKVWASVCAGIGRNPKCTLLRMMGLNAVGKFADGELDFVYHDANHSVDAVRADVSAWWPKVKIGGIVAGHDYFTRYDNTGNCDAATAVAEIAEAIGVRVHLTWDSSWWILKTPELDERFRLACEEGRIPRPVYVPKADYPVVVVLPVARFDWNLAVKFLTWWAKVLKNDGNPFPVVAFCSPDLNKDQLNALCGSGLPNLTLVTSKIKELGYFGTPNQMIKGALEFCEEVHPGRAVLWAEADAVPMCATWVDEIMAEFNASGRAFMGDIHGVNEPTGIPHLTGNAVHHPNWRALAPSLAALGKEACAWDALCAHDLVPRSHYAKTIQQVWRPPLPITAEWAKKNIRPETGLFHQCKDGSLIDVLCDEAGIERIPLAKALCESTYERDRRTVDSSPGPRVHVFNATEPKVLPAPPPFVSKLKTEVLIVTHAADVKFLRFCLLGIKKNASGFSGVTLLVPAAEHAVFKDIPQWVNVQTFDQVPGKGVMHHVLKKCRADEICPNADAIMHVDSDTIMWLPCTPADYMPDDKPIIVRERYSTITNTNRHVWKKNVFRALGINTEFDTMVRHPNVYLRDLYPLMRSEVEKHTGKPFDEFAMSGRNEFPQDLQEFEVLGSTAIHYCPEKYTMVDYNHDRDGRECGVPHETPFQYLYRNPRDRFVECWSHGGIERYRNDLSSFINGHVPEFYLK